MLTIVWDVDDVLNDLMQSWFTAAWKPAHQNCGLSYTDITENPPDRVLGISRAEYLASLDEFRLSEQCRNMRPNAKVLQWLDRHGRCFRHMALTARPLATAPSGAEWLFRHFGGYVRGFWVVPSRLDASLPSYDRDKRDFLRWFGQADVLVDDNEENIRAAEDMGICGVVYPQPWNTSPLAVEDVLGFLLEQVEAC
jgi:hypothetical protein